jgi:hypothetical protein
MDENLPNFIVIENTTRRRKKRGGKSKWKTDIGPSSSSHSFLYSEQKCFIGPIVLLEVVSSIQPCWKGIPLLQCQLTNMSGDIDILWAWVIGTWVVMHSCPLSIRVVGCDHPLWVGGEITCQNPIHTIS